MKSLIKKYGLIILLLLSVAAIYSCSDAEGSENKTVEEKVRAVSVQVKELNSREYTDYIQLIGVVQAVRKTALSSSEAAKINSVRIDKGYNASKGDTIIVMDNDILKATLAAAEAQYSLDQITFEMQEVIYKDNVNSEYQYLQSKYRRDQSKANYDLTKARYEKTFITAPFDGRVDRRYFEVGEFVTPGMPVVDLISAAHYKVEAGVPERYVALIKKGAKARIKLKNAAGDELEGVVTYVGSSILVDNRTFPIEVSINTKSIYLKPEVAVEVYVENGRYENIFLVPDEVVTRLDEGYVVFVEDNGVARSRPIEILNRSGESVAVKTGLKDGDKLVVVGQQNLIDGQLINIVN
jgi:RND family efflux transporter MFP subunit